MKPRTPRPLLTLATAPDVLLLREYCALMRESERRVRAQVTAGACRVAPRLVRPYRWLRSDLEHYLSTITLPADRRAHRLRLEDVRARDARRSA